MRMRKERPRDPDSQFHSASGVVRRVENSHQMLMGGSNKYRMWKREIEEIMKVFNCKVAILQIAAALLLPTLTVMAQDKPPVEVEGTTATDKTPGATASSDQLRKVSQNPIANLINVPFQENPNFGIGAANRVQNVLNIQPVIPFSMGKKVNLITRWITPIIYQPIHVPQPIGPPEQLTGVSGLGDINPSFVFSPKVSKVIWGAGITAVFPAATNTTYLGHGTSTRTAGRSGDEDDIVLATSWRLLSPVENLAGGLVCGLSTGD